MSQFPAQPQRRDRPSADPLRPLVDQSLQLVEAALANGEIALGDRLNLALQVLALQPQGEAGSQAQSPNLGLLASWNEDLGAVAEDALEFRVEAVQQLSGRSRPSALEALEPGWRDWLIENKQRGCTDAVLLQSMVEKDIDAGLAAQALRDYAQAPQRRAPEPLTPELQRLQKLESVMATQRKVRKLSAQSRQIERRPRVSKQEFLDRYYATNTPVILTDMLQDWPALAKWTPDYLKAEYGQAEVEVQLGRNADSNYEINTFQHKTTMTLADYADRVLSAGETNDLYMVANNRNLEKDALKGLLDDLKMPDFLDPAQTNQQVFFWFGPAGTVTPLHHDPLNVMMAHFYGSKRWRLVSPTDTPLVYNHIGVFSQVDLENPNFEQYPLFEEADVIETVLEPGEIIFVPVGWWHQVKALDVSIAVSFSNFAFPNQFDYKNPTQAQAATQADIQFSAQAPAKNLAQTSVQTSVQTSAQATAQLTNRVVETTDACWLMDRIVPGAPLLLSFGFVSWDSPPRFDFFGRSKKLEALTQQPLNRILLRDPLNAWYQRGVPGLGETVDDVAQGLRSLIAQAAPSKVITIGQSMGGYAAILFGQLLGVDQILAFGPLSFLDSARAKQIGDRRWLSVMEALEADPPPILYSDLVTICQLYQGSADMRIIYGQKSEPSADSIENLDEYHAQRLGELPHCRLYPYAESEHAVVKHLIDTQQIDRFLQAAIWGSAIGLG